MPIVYINHSEKYVTMTEINAKNIAPRYYMYLLIPS